MAGSIVFVLIAETAEWSAVAWCFMVASVIMCIYAIPVLRDSQDIWALPHAMFGAVLVSLWATCFRDSDAYAPQWSWLLTLTVAVLWELFEWHVLQPWSNKLPAGHRCKLVFYPPENILSPPVDIGLAVGVHALLQNSPVTRTMLDNSAPVALIVFGSAQICILLLLIMLGCTNRQMRASTGAGAVDMAHLL